MTFGEFEELKRLITEKREIRDHISAEEQNIAEINMKLRDSVQELFRPMVGRFYKKVGKVFHGTALPDEWFIVADVPQSGWSIVNGCMFEEDSIPVKVMGKDGMPATSIIRISPEMFGDNGSTLPTNIIEVTEDEWFAEQRRRVKAAADRQMQKIIDENKR